MARTARRWRQVAGKGRRAANRKARAQTGGDRNRWNRGDVRRHAKLYIATAAAAVQEYRVCGAGKIRGDTS